VTLVPYSDGLHWNAGIRDVITVSARHLIG
jgi:hypothetical protein